MIFIDMFCGIRGFRLGLERANQESKSWGEAPAGQDLQSRGDCPMSTAGNEGKHTTPNEDFRCVWANDNDKYACQISRKHYPNDNLYEGDIRTVDVDAIPEHDLLCAGFPCQSFSIAGKRRGFEDTRGTLFFEICRALRAKRPPYLFLENVKGLLSPDDGDTFQTIIGTLDELGYDCQWQVLNSKDYGVPQNRERVFIIGHLRGRSRPKVFPIGETDEIIDRGDAEVANALQSPGHAYGNYRGMTMIGYGINNRFCTDISPTLVSASKKDGHQSGFGTRTPLVYHENISGTKTPHTEAQALRSGASHNYQTVNRIRRLTPVECERLQGFPDGWTEGISNTQRYKCLGNAVTVNVIEAIGRQFLISEGKG